MLLFLIMVKIDESKYSSGYYKKEYVFEHQWKVYLLRLVAGVNDISSEFIQIKNNELNL